MYVKVKDFAPDVLWVKNPARQGRCPYCFWPRYFLTRYGEEWALRKCDACGKEWKGRFDEDEDENNMTN